MRFTEESPSTGISCVRSLGIVECGTNAKTNVVMKKVGARRSLHIILPPCTQRREVYGLIAKSLGNDISETISLIAIQRHQSKYFETA